MSKIAISNILENPKNPRNMDLPVEKAQLEKLVKSIRASGGVLEPVSVVAIEEGPHQIYFKNAADLKGKYMIVSGHRRIAAVRSIMNSLLEEAEAKGKDPNEALGNWPMIEANILDSKAAGDIQIKALVANTNRQDVDLLSKAKGLELARRMIEQDNLIAALDKAGANEEMKKKARARHDENIANGKWTLNAKKLGDMMGVSPSYISRYFTFLEFPADIQKLFIDMTLPEALIGELSAAINEGNLTWPEIYAWLSKKKDEKERTWAVVSTEIKEMRKAKKGANEDGSGDKENSGENKDGTTPEGVKAKNEHDEKREAVIARLCSAFGWDTDEAKKENIRKGASNTIILNKGGILLGCMTEDIGIAKQNGRDLLRARIKNFAMCPIIMDLKAAEALAEMKEPEADSE